jgi:hypothetical protein
VLIAAARAQRFRNVLVHGGILAHGTVNARLQRIAVNGQRGWRCVWDRRDACVAFQRCLAARKHRAQAFSCTSTTVRQAVRCVTIRAQAACGLRGTRGAGAAHQRARAMPELPSSLRQYALKTRSSK